MGGGEVTFRRQMCVDQKNARLRRENNCITPVGPHSPPPTPGSPVVHRGHTTTGKKRCRLESLVSRGDSASDKE
jgi:hypothetical protein